MSINNFCDTSLRNKIQTYDYPYSKELVINFLSEGESCCNEGTEWYTINTVITQDHINNCTSGYKWEVGKPAWFTQDLLKQFLPDLMSKKEIADHFYTQDKNQYHAENFAITFKCEKNTKCGNNINYTWNAPSNMWCNKEGKIGNANLLCPEYFLNDDTSVCCPSTAPYWSYEYSKNFFLNDKCPNLILDLKEEELAGCAGKTIAAKLEAPLMILDYYDNIIDKNGNNTQIQFSDFKKCLNPDGTMKNRSCDEENWLKYKQMRDEVLWASDKEVKLKIPETIGKELYYSAANSQDEVFPYHYQSSDLI